MNPWYDTSHLENHFCHKHELFHDDLTGVPCCYLCRDAKVAAFLRKQNIQKETQDGRTVPKEP